MQVPLPCIIFYWLLSDGFLSIYGAWGLNILSVEGERTELANKLSSAVSPRIKLLYLFYFYNILLKSKSSNLIESYLPGQIENYITFLYKFEPAVLSPQLVENILKQIEQISQQSCIKQFYDRLSSAEEHLRIKYIPVKRIFKRTNSKWVWRKISQHTRIPAQSFEKQDNRRN